MTVGRSAEEALREHAQATIAGDLRRTVLDLTPEAFGKMLLGTEGRLYQRFELVSSWVDGDDHLFRVRYEGEAGANEITYRWRQMEGVWKVVDVEFVD
jgi:hypothetical protein